MNNIALEDVRTSSASSTTPWTATTSPSSTPSTTPKGSNHQTFTISHGSGSHNGVQLKITVSQSQHQSQQQHQHDLHPNKISGDTGNTALLAKYLLQLLLQKKLDKINGSSQGIMTYSLAYLFYEKIFRGINFR